MRAPRAAWCRASRPAAASLTAGWPAATQCTVPSAANAHLFAIADQGMTQVRSCSSKIGGRYFTKTHEWFQDEGSGVGTVGITHVAQRALGEVVFCRLPCAGERFGQMETIATLEALKTVGEVKCPVHGEVLEVNPRLDREPALVSYAPLTEGWLLRVAFSGRVPKYLRGSHTVSRSVVAESLGEQKALQAFILEHLGGPLPLENKKSRGPAAELEDEAEQATESGPMELAFSGLYSSERAVLHLAAEELGLYTKSRGIGPGRKLIVRRRPPASEKSPERVEGGPEDEDWPERNGGSAGSPIGKGGRRAAKGAGASAGFPLTRITTRGDKQNKSIN